MIQLLHTPEGVRDIYGAQCRRKSELEAQVMSCMHCHGYQDIETPSFEYFDIFNKERGTVPSKDMYKFFDREGNTLVMRPDFTPSIARCVAKYYRASSVPVRLSYRGNAFINNSSYQGRLKETTQTGVELIGDDSVLADADMIAMTVECILACGIREFQVEIGNADFYKGLIEETGFSAEEQEELRVLIKNKNLFGEEEMLSEKNISENLKTIFSQMPQLFGSIDCIRSVRALTANKRALAALDRMEQLYQLLCAYGYEKYVSFDLGMLSKYNYYTGIIFRAITYGTGEAIASGGRYDSLMKQFGVNAPAIGMAITLDYVMIALERQGMMPETVKNQILIVYDAKHYEKAIQTAMKLRKEGKCAAFLQAEKAGDTLLAAKQAEISEIIDVTKLGKE